MRKQGSILIYLGLVMLLGALVLTAYNLWDARRADAAAQEVLVQLQEVIPTVSAPQDPWEKTDTETFLAKIPDRPMPTTLINGYTYIGVLEIPDLSLSLPVLESWDYTRLNIAPCRYSGTTYQKNLVLCAHNYPKHFGPIGTLSLGAALSFTDADGVVTHYQVSDQETIRPDDLKGMTEGDWDLTLFTCTTSGQTRTAVRCTLVEEIRAGF